MYVIQRNRAPPGVPTGSSSGAAQSLSLVFYPIRQLVRDAAAAADILPNVVRVLLGHNTYNSQHLGITSHGYNTRVNYLQERRCPPPLTSYLL